MQQASTTAAVAGGVQELVPLRSHVCLPGDPVLLLDPTAVVALGNGLRPVSQAPTHGGGGGATTAAAGDGGNTVVVAELCGPVTCSVGPNNVRRYTIDASAARRYVYAPRDPVVAVVLKKTTSYCYCYTGAAMPAVLDALSFDGATKSSRPRLQEGDVVYAFVKPKPAATAAAAVEDASDEVELSCLAGDVGLVAKDWTSAEAVFGPLAGGTVVRVPIPYARSLLADDGAAAPLLSQLGARVPFEVCVGVNGLVWVRGQASDVDAAAAARRTVAVAACIVEAQDDATPEEMERRVRSYFPGEVN
ncbi:putative DNA ligase I [Trypanosoma conorhini]|uniref:Putative DNA ligase I n=1 Tax=Trypanosoma conorhini TaxID=83891 RepID=A0A3R7MI40_9TRYP|nr:putative DNA ligase I [Trypanosoma conorhini]RNF15524.1 putative DNA ligase I [Trypanosoma conorhini]